MPWEETQDFIRSGHRDPEEFEPDSLRTITLSEEEGIKAVIGKPKGKKTTEVVSYLFSKEKEWTLEKAKQWFSEHQAKAKESFSWAGSIKELPEASNLIRGKALHPIRTVHPEEWPEVREYLEEELQKSAHTLTGKPLILDHFQVLRGKVLGAEYEDGAIEYVAQLNDQGVMELIKNGAIKHCSVEFEWKSLEQVNGIAPRGLNFTGLSLLRLFEPGDPLTSVEIWNNIVEALMEAKNVRRGGNLGMSTAKEQAGPQEFILYMLHDPMAFLPEHFSTAWIDQTNGIQGIFGRLREDPENSVPQALLFMKANNWDLAKMQDWLQNHPQYLRASAPAQPGIQPASGDTGVMKMSKEKRPQTLEGRVTFLETSKLLKEQELSKEEIEAKINELTEQRQKLQNELQQIAEEEQPRRDEIWQQIDLINAELQAYEQALAALIAGLTQPSAPGTTEEINEFRERLKKYPVYIQEAGLDLLNDRRPLSELNKLLEAEWDIKYINNLPDSAFAYIEPGGEKDDQGKTTPRALRHLPFKNAEDNIDHDHLVNALARLPQTDLSEDAKAQAQKKLCAAVGTWNSEHEDKIESDVCGTATEQQGNQEPEKDEHGCKIGEERYDEEQDTCVPIVTGEAIKIVTKTLKATEQAEDMTVEDIKHKIADLTKQKQELVNKLYPESTLSEEEKVAIQAQIDTFYAEIEAYEKALAAKITGQAAEKKKSLGEAIIAPGTSEPQPSDLISRKEVLALIPDRRVWRSWSYGPQIMVKKLKHLLQVGE